MLKCPYLVPPLNLLYFLPTILSLEIRNIYIYLIFESVIKTLQSYLMIDLFVCFILLLLSISSPHLAHFFINTMKLF